jgi:excisionase family DNA binding protein
LQVVTSEPLLDSKSAAARLGTTERHIRSLVERREIPFRKVGRLNRFVPAELDAWLEANKVEAVG